MLQYKLQKKDSDLTIVKEEYEKEMTWKSNYESMVEKVRSFINLKTENDENES